MHHLITRITVVFAIFMKLACHDFTYAMENREPQTDFLTLLPMETLTQIFWTVPETTLCQLSTQSKYLNDFYKKYHGVALKIDGPKVYDFLQFLQKGIPYGKINQLVLSGSWLEAGKNEIYSNLFGKLSKITSLKLDNVKQDSGGWILMATLMPKSLKTLGFDMNNLFEDSAEFRKISHIMEGRDRWGRNDSKMSFYNYLPSNLETICWDNLRNEDLFLLKNVSNINVSNISVLELSFKNSHHKNFSRSFQEDLKELCKVKSIQILIFRNLFFGNLIFWGSLDVKSRLLKFSEMIGELPKQLKIFRIIGHDLDCCDHNDMFIDIIRKLPVGLEVFELSRNSNEICFKEEHKSKELDLAHLPNLKSIDVSGCCMNPDLLIISVTKVDYLTFSFADQLVRILLSGGIISDDCLFSLTPDLLVNIINKHVTCSEFKINKEIFYKIIFILYKNNCKELDSKKVALVICRLMQKEIVQNDYLRILPSPLIAEITKIIMNNDAEIIPEMFYHFASTLREKLSMSLNMDEISFLKTRCQLLELAYKRGYVFPIEELGDLCYEIALKIKPIFRSDDTGSSIQREIYFRKGTTYKSTDCIIRLSSFYLDPYMYGDVPNNRILFEDQITKALDLLTPLVNGGNVEAQYYMGVVYNKFPNKINAIKWFKLAAAQGHEAAQNALDDLTK